ncbi:MAG: hypothetical protein G01um101425_1008 [Candidatus Peregrinibacteria bacterium Gr01-1014_25]|nr:MAG: hypothetical protein G01um101425_1008 [Candidatus Peregrinibacteria bacterium Gr01-1014_25]
MNDMLSPLTPFITHARGKGMDHATIRLLLLSAGWKEKDIAEALAAEGLSMPVPVPPDRGGAREAFFHLLTFASLYVTLVSLTILFFTYINRLFPDLAFEGRTLVPDDFSGIRWSLAATIVTFPLFLFLSRLLLREMRDHPERAWSAIRRWLTYLTLFITALALIGDGVTLLFYLLEGELTARFLLKVGVVFLLAGLTFIYYFLALRAPAEGRATTDVPHRLFGGLMLVVVLAALIWGFVLAGSPGAERVRKFDERRVEDLRMLRDEIVRIAHDGRWPDERTVRLTRQLPATLEDVQEQAQYQRPSIVDPETGEPYTYRIVDRTRFELCAVFATPRDWDVDIVWNHPVGEHCFMTDALKPDTTVKPMPARPL